MPAEVLNRHRLAQIIITLVILSSVFLWRTFSHDELITHTCFINKKCELIVNNFRITITKSTEMDELYIMQPVDNSWTIKPLQNMRRVGDQVLFSQEVKDITIPELGIRIHLVAN